MLDGALCLAVLLPSSRLNSSPAAPWLACPPPTTHAMDQQCRFSMSLALGLPRVRMHKHAVGHLDTSGEGVVELMRCHGYQHASKWQGIVVPTCLLRAATAGCFPLAAV